MFLLYMVSRLVEELQNRMDQGATKQKEQQKEKGDTATAGPRDKVNNKWKQSTRDAWVIIRVGGEFRSR